MGRVEGRIIPLVEQIAGILGLNEEEEDGGRNGREAATTNNGVLTPNHDSDSPNGFYRGHRHSAPTLPRLANLKRLDR